MRTKSLMSLSILSSLLHNVEFSSGLDRQSTRSTGTSPGDPLIQIAARVPGARLLQFLLSCRTFQLARFKTCTSASKRSPRWSFSNSMSYRIWRLSQNRSVVAK